MKKRHIIAVCGSPLILAEIKAELNGCFDVSIYQNAESAFPFLDKYGASAIVFCSADAHEKDFPELSSVVAHVKQAGIPVIFLTEKDDENDEVKVFEAGAADYAIMRHGGSKALISRINLRIGLAERENRDNSGAKTILIAEDVELNREIIRSILSEAGGLTLEFAVNGSEAVNKFEKEPTRFSLILMDVNMPVMDGLTAARTIRSLKCENSKDIPIIAMTAYINHEEINECLKSGMDDFIKKPMSYEDLSEIIAKHC